MSSRANRKFERMLMGIRNEQPVKIKFRVSFLFAWYDLWIGAFWDSKKKWLYILPLPCLGIILKFK